MRSEDPGFGLCRRGDYFFAAWVWILHWAGVLHASALLEDPPTVFEAEL